MNRRQKIAWFQLAIVGAAAIVNIILTGLFVRKYEYGFLEAWWTGTGYSVPCIILAVLAPPVIFRKKKGQIDFDERELTIDHRAMQITFATTYAYFIAVCMTTWVVAGFDKPIPAYWLAWIVLGGWITSIVVHSLTTLVCYGRGGKGEKS
jgi:cytochrome b561